MAAFEFAALPALGAPSFVGWCPRELALVIVQAIAFGVAVALADEWL